MPLNRISQAFDTLSIRSLPNQTSNLLDIIGTTGEQISSVTSAGFLMIGSGIPGVPLHVRNSNFGYGNPVSTNTPTVLVESLNNSSGIANAILATRVGGAAGGDPFVSFDINGVIGWSIGLDNSDSDKFKISNSWADVGISPVITLSPGAIFSLNSTSLTLGSSAAAHQFGIVSNAAANVVSVFRGATSQTSDLAQWQNAASTTLTSINSSGHFLTPRINFTGGTSTISAQTLADGTISFDSTAGQLFSISNSLTGTIFAVNDISGLPSVEITDLGIIKFNELYGQTVIGSGTPATNAMLSSIARTSATIPLVVRGAASQSANLQEWQNSTPATVASISNTGAITAVDLTLSGNLTVNGTTTNINTTNLVVEDKNIILADVASPSTTTADGGGITLLAGGSNKTFNWINATDRWTSSVGLEGSSIVRTGGTSAQFLKADGTVDSSTYLTTGTASSTYAPINNPTFTGNVIAPLFRVGSAPYYQYETQVGGGTDLGFKKLATITLPTGLYTGLSFYIEVIEVGGNYGNTAASTKSVYFVSAIRSGGVQDDAMSMSLTGPSTNRYLQGVKVDSATYEIQVRTPSNYNHLVVRGFGVSGLNSSVVWSNATVAGSTGIATYTPTSGSNEWFGNVKFWGTLSKDGGTSAQFLKADGSIDSSTYITGSSPTINTATVSNSIIVAPEERFNIVAAAATGTINIDALTAGVWYYTSNATANHTINLRGSGASTMNSILATGDSITVVWMNTNGTTAYYPNVFQIDGTAVTPKWANGAAPSAGNASSIDVYTYNIIKTAASTYTVLASQSRFA